MSPARRLLLRQAAPLAALLLVGGCTASSPADLSSPRATPPPLPRSGPARASDAAAPLLQGSVLSARDLYPAYRAILDDYVEPVSPATLLQAAQTAVRQATQQQPRPMPLSLMPMMLAPAATGNAEADWTAFANGFDGLVQTSPEWAASRHLDWVALRAMVAALKDSQSAFLTPSQIQERDATNYGGIGVEITPAQDGQGPLITQVFPSSPAEQAGLRRGDRIVQVNGQSVAGKDIAAVAGLIRGPVGQTVTVRISRYGNPQPTDVRLARAQVQVDPADGVMAQDVGILHINNFNTGANQQVRALLAAGASRGARAWILDLRGNAGGSVNEVGSVAGAFLSQGHTLLGYEVGRSGTRTPLNASSPTSKSVGPLVVLVDKQTASGAEILAAALQAQGVAKIVGQPTAGAVGVSSTIPLDDGSALQLTRERFVTPSGQQINGKGVQPDVQVALTDQDLEQGRDPQLQAAAQVLTQLRAGGGS